MREVPAPGSEEWALRAATPTRGVVHPTRVRRAICAVVVALLAGCSSGASSGSESDSAIKSDTDSSTVIDTSDLFDGSSTELVVRVYGSRGYTEHFPGAEVPAELSIYGDGRVIGYRRFVGALPDLRQTKADRGELARAVADLEHAGVLRDKPDLGEPDITDLDSTQVLVRSNGRDVKISAYALGEDSGLTSGQRRRRSALQKFIGKAESQLDRSSKRWDPPSMAVMVETADSSSGSSGSSSGPMWPFEPLTGNSGCVLLDRSQVQQIMPIARGAEDTSTLWKSEGRLWALLFLPVLPGEKGCTPS